MSVRADSVRGMAEVPTTEQGEHLVQRLHQTAAESLGDSAARAAALGGWSSPHWLVLRTLAEIESATVEQIAELLDDYQRVYASPDAATAALARHAREALHLWPSRGGLIEPTLTMARRGGLADCDWRGRGRRWLWWATDTGRAVFAAVRNQERA